ncbi:LytR/AlgR family response regulator transcription factor [[Clostridium] polysaccharolyticum]|uniref:Stage 0 sporulation protein A homolog n=1 Tax=[Clostridium] polysaccharolyticum TaxID=29364 RepID=A0A1I0BTX3_9FIRM|nr:LytTR family DNA-binding domain-containing protein [[Clostridium] polysaccharolyticum]SET10067.1 two component transcriptional regulator, LytTR family [[Clostridium] polysaccharolyticum]
MGIKIIICDEDRISLKINITYMEEFSQKYKVPTEVLSFDRIEDSFYQYISENTIDIALLDMKFKNCDGIFLAREIQKKNPWVSIIFITEKTEHMLEAFNLLATGFILKPIKQLQLEKLFARSIIQAQSFRNRRFGSNIDFTVNKTSVSIQQSSILYLEKLNQKTRIHTSHKHYETYETLTSIQNRLETTFLRVNQSILVNLLQVGAIEQNEIYLKTGEHFRIGRSYIKKVKDTFSKYPYVYL